MSVVRILTEYNKVLVPFINFVAVVFYILLEYFSVRGDEGYERLALSVGV